MEGLDWRHRTLYDGVTEDVMNITLIDVSGSLYGYFDEMAKKVSPSDYVILFDHNIKSVGHVRPLTPWGGGGTSVTKGLEEANRLDPNANVRIITDGYFDRSELDKFSNLNIKLDLVQQ